MVFPEPAVLDLECFLNMWPVLPIPDEEDLILIVQKLYLEFVSILLATVLRNQTLRVELQLLHV